MTYKENLGQLNVGASKYGKEKKYWLDKLSGDLGSRCFPYDRPGNADKRSMEIIKFDIPSKLSSRLIEIAGGSEIRLHMILTAGVVTLLHKYTDDKDILVGIPIYKQKVEGEFTNTALVIRNTIEEGMTFKKLIIQVRQSITGAMENANCPIEILLYHLNIPSSQGGFPLFDVAILLENIHDKKYLQHIRNNMIFSFQGDGTHLEGTLEYNAAVFKKTTEQRILRHFLEMFLNAAFNPDSSLSEISLLPEAERNRILEEFNNNKVEFAGAKSISNLVEKQAAISPHRVAVVFEGKELTYGELDENANRLARLLKNNGMQAERLVGILLDRSPRMVEAILAAWKTGGAYIPIDTNYPPQRIVAILNDSSAVILLTEAEFENHGIAERYKGKIFKLEQEMKAMEKKNPLDPGLEINMNSPAYVIYTSGSTGTPKGVIIEHIGMMNHIYAKVKDLHLTMESIAAQNASHTFDISVWQFFAASAVGGRTVIYPNPLIMDPERFISRLKKDRVTILEVVPSYLAVMLETLAAHFETLEYLRFLLVTGEAVRPALLEKWFTQYPGIPVLNAYGPTEASDDITHYIMDQLPDSESIPIGKPIQNLNIYIVDNNLRLCPIGLKGEICVSGIGVGRGYLNDPGKTQAAFRGDPFPGKRAIRFYRTGDIGCWTGEGVIDFFGRTDTQVKIRGYRIELGEIESKLVNHPQVKEAVVITLEEDESLCAYVAADHALELSELKLSLMEQLPEYSVPSHFVKLDRFPLTPNGKIDRKNLPKPESESPVQMPYITEADLKNVAIKPGKKLVNFEISMKEADKEYQLSGDELEQILFKFNNTAVEYPKDKLPHQLIEEQVEKTPGRVAIGHKGNYLTYRRLNERANQLARLLRAKGVTKNYLVGILTHRNVELITGILGILKAGGAYLPIDPESPKDRKKYMVELSEVQLLLTNKENREIGASISQIIGMEDEANYHGDTANLPVQSAPTDSIHVLYTSGTTGAPKGVMIENRSIVNLIKGVTDLVPVDETDIVFSIIPTTFDMFGSETILPLTKGSLIMLGTMEEKNNFKLAAQALEKECATYYQVTPTLLQFMVSDADTVDCLKTLKYLIVAGEAFPTALRDKVAKAMPGRIFNFYGPTEAAIYATGKDVTRVDSLNNIGKPLANVNIYILNSNRKVIPVGVVGELYIGGDGVARGYLKEDDLTAEKFIDNPFVKGDRLYRTGDLAKWLPEGEIQLLGRIDHQVQVRGIRVEPGEIENVLLKQADIKEAAVVAKENEGGQIDLFGCVVSEKRLPGEKLRKELMDKLPGYMIPGYFIQLEKMPLTPNGKINRRLLESIEVKEGVHLKRETPRNPVEEKLAEIWEEVLGRKDIGIHDNFFMIGGDSIKTIQIASRMKKAGYKIEMKDIFENPTIAQLAPLIKKAEQTADQSPVTGIVPLTPIQQAFFSDLPAEPHHFNMAILLFSGKRLEEKAVRAVFTRLQEHHDALRMTFKTSEDEIVQTNHGLEYPLELCEFDLAGMAYPEAAASLEQKANEMQRSICLEKGPLMKLGLFHLDDGDRLLMVIHHLVMDGISWRILLEDIGTLFHQYQNHESLTLPMKTDSFKTWAEQLSRYANSELFLKEKAYWEKLESAIVPGIEKDSREEIDYQRDSETLKFRLSEEETELLLTKVNNAFNTEINDILITSLGLAVKNNFGIGSVLIELEGHGREAILENIDINRTVGWFTSAYPMILDVSYEHDLARQVKEIKENLHRVPHKGIGYGILKYITAEENKKDMEFRLNPQIAFNYLGQFDEDIKQTGFGLAKEKTGDTLAPGTIRKYEFDLVGVIIDKRLEMSISYNKKQYRKQTAEAFLDHLKSKLLRVISFCSERENQELTPSDFGYKEISLDQLDKIFD